jgi:hypothetical protein
VDLQAKHRKNLEQKNTEKLRLSAIFNGFGSLL